MVDAVGVALDVAVHHGGAGEHPQRMGGVHHLQPRVHVALAQPDLGADRWCKDLAAAARERAHARLLEADQHPLDLLDERFAGGIEEVDELDELGWGERVDLDMWEALADAVEQFQVPVEGQVGVHAALHEDLGAADVAEFLHLLVQLFVFECVGVVLVALTLEGTEDALGGADVGVVDVAVDDEGADMVAVDYAAACVGIASQRVQGGAGQEFKPLLGGQAGLPLGHGSQQPGILGAVRGELGQRLVDGAHAGLGRWAYFQESLKV